MKLTAAFFDVDETLIKMKSMFHFYQYWSESRQWTSKHQQFTANFKNAVAQGVTREELNKMYYREFAGVDIEDLYHMGEAWFNKYLSHNETYIACAVEALQQHKINGQVVVFISGSMLPLLKPLGRRLGADAILCTPLLLNDKGLLTGEIGEPQTIGMGKQRALLAFSHGKNINLMTSYAYGDDLSDIPMLETIGHPVCVGEYSNLAEYAEKNQWKILKENIPSH
ncbi:HAD-IB family hydrolase [Sodalis sp. RH22]|uniref:HAD-IB family hydrolase n=1 Tax=unclassified Sodalis (in: enterobacteria) TaxID=2636512 RepID=UPI0039B63FC0